jgi:glycosyltransferase involved in cell wall biosynthesis
MSEASAVTPRVSVILTVFTRMQFLPEALHSVLTQSYQDFELIVADDSGHGASRSMIEACGDSRIRYVANPATIGVAASLVQAASIARGQFVAILNDDDVWERELLSDLVAPLEDDPRRVLAAADHWIMDPAGQIDHAKSQEWTASFKRAHLSEGELDSASAFAIDGGPAINIAAVFRRDAIDWSLLVPEVAGGYDYWIGCLLAATGRPLYYVPRRLARWRTHSQMETLRRSHDRGESLVYIYSTLRTRRWFLEQDAVLRARLADALVAAARDKLHFGRPAEARERFWRAFLVGRDLRALLRVAATFLPQQILSWWWSRQRVQEGLRSTR